MDSGVFVPLLLPLVAWPLAHLIMKTGLRPRTASWLLAASSLVLAIGSTSSLIVLTFAGLSLVPLVARIGEWSPQTLRGLEVASVPAEMVCGLALAAVAVSVVVAGLRYLRWRRGLCRAIDQAAARAELIVLPDCDPMAVAVPFRGGRVVVSKAMLAALSPTERGALLAHERAHLRCRHDLFLTATALATLLNPLLWPLRSAAVYALERWADEAAAQRVGDRRVVASAVAKAALAAPSRMKGALAAAGGPVPRRVRALLTEPAPHRDWQVVAALCAAVTIAVTAWSVQASLEAAADLHAGIETASLDHHHHHPPTM